MKKIAVIGLGLIGTSLLKALQGKGYDLYGISRNPITIQKALDEKLIKDGSCEFDLLKSVDLIFIATPIDCVLETISKIKDTAPDKTIADLASVKGFILDYVNNLNTELDFVGLHPMAGTENQGFDSAEEGLFDDSKWAVIPSYFAKDKSVEKICEIIKDINAEPVMTDAKTHDRAVAMISHMPMVLAQALFSTIQDESALTNKLASSGFRDMTRLAGTNIQIAKDMMKYNKTNISEVTNKLKAEIDSFLQDYENKGLENLAKKRKQMYSDKGKNLY